MVLVCVTAFKGCPKIQDRWENREYVVEKWPYPNVPVYVVCPRNGEGCSWTLHSNYFLPINPTLGLGEKDAPMTGVESNNASTPAPPVDSDPADADHFGQSLQVQQVTHPQGSPDQPASLRCGTPKPGTDFHGGTRILVYRQVPGHPTSGMHGLVFMPYLVYTTLSGDVQCELHSTVTIECLPSTTHFGIEGNSLNVVSMVDFWVVGEWTKGYLAQAHLPH